MSSPYRAGGDGRSVAFPRVPWHDEAPLRPVARRECRSCDCSRDDGCRQTERQAEHATSIAYQGETEGDGGLYYFYCSCGICGHLHALRKTAVTEADLHLEAIA